MTGGIVRERGEILQVAHNVAAANLDRFQREASVKERLLQLTRSRLELLEQMARAMEERSKAGEQVATSEGEVRARLAEQR